MGGHALLPGIFPTQGSNPGFLLYRWILYQLSHQWGPRILEWVAYPFSRASSWPRYRTRVSYTEGGFFPTSATREAHWMPNKCQTLWFALITECSMDRPVPLLIERIIWRQNGTLNVIMQCDRLYERKVRGLWEKKRQSGAKGLLPEEVLSRLKSCEFSYLAESCQPGESQGKGFLMSERSCLKPRGETP